MAIYGVMLGLWCRHIGTFELFLYLWASVCISILGVLCILIEEENSVELDWKREICVSFVHDIAVCIVAVNRHLCRTLSTTNNMMHVPMIEVAIIPNTT